MLSPRPRAARSLCLRLLSAFAAVAWTTASSAQQSAEVRPFVTEDFSDGLDSWQEQRLDRRSTEFRVVELDGNAVLEARSDNAAAALLFPLAKQPASGVRLRWRWRVDGSLTENSRETEKKGDDYAARIFVLFGDSELNSDTRAIAYAWAGQQAAGSVYPNPYISEVSTIVLRSGNRHAGSWVGEDRDIRADYQRAFGEAPPELAAIAVVVDTDDTSDEVVAWFDDFQLVRPVAAAGGAGAGVAGLGIGTPGLAGVGVRVGAAATGPSLVVALAEDLRETAGLPALSIAVLEDGEITYAEAFGLASLDGQRPATVDTRFRAASVSKTITATAVAKLVQEERLDLDAPVTQYVPSWPEPPPITPRMLAGHLAGVAHYQGADRIERNRHYVSVAEALGVFRDSPRSGAPGEEYTYSTHGFTLLSAVVEGAAGRPFLEYLDAEIFGPLGMQGSGPDLRESPSPETAVLYGRRAGQPFALAAPEDPSYKWGAGGLLSTPSDLVRMARGYLTGFIAPDIVEEMWTSQTTADGEATGVGIGWRVGEDFAGRRIVHHAGAMGGARSVLVIYPEAETAVSLMTNTIWVSAIEQTAQLVLEAYLASAAECPSAFAGIASNEPYTGDFSDAEGPHQAEGTVSLDGCAGDIDTPQPLRDWMATAAVDRMPIHHLRENRWVLVMPYGLAPMELERTSDGKLTGRVQLTPTRVWEFVTE